MNFCLLDILYMLHRMQDPEALAHRTPVSILEMIQVDLTKRHLLINLKMILIEFCRYSLLLLN